MFPGYVCFLQIMLINMVEPSQLLFFPFFYNWLQAKGEFDWATKKNSFELN